MTMHLVGPYLTTTNYRKSKTKVTKAKLKQWQDWYQEDCKRNKRMGQPKRTFDEFVDALHGKVKREKPVYKPLIAEPDAVSLRIQEHKAKYPSMGSFGDANSTAKKEPQKYTGTLIKGIATMHKSNAVPVINDEQAQEISRMRRG